MGSSGIFFSRVGGKIGGEKAVDFFRNITEGTGASCIDNFTLVNNIETFRPGFIQVFERILDTVDNERTGKLRVMGKLESDTNSLKKS